MKSKTLPAWARLVCTAAAALVFLLVYEWAVYGVPLGRIYLPASAWSDEVYYAKQLSAVVTHGVPQGYFGFNESHAEIGRFAAWGPAVFYLYAIPGLIFRGQNAFLSVSYTHLPLETETTVETVAALEKESEKAVHALH